MMLPLPLLIHARPPSVQLPREFPSRPYVKRTIVPPHWPSYKLAGINPKFGCANAPTVWFGTLALSLMHLLWSVGMSMSDAIREKRDTQTTLEPLLIALEHIEAQGSLLLLSTDHAHRVRIMKAMTELELVEWNALIKKYEMTSYGRQCLAEYRGTTDPQLSHQSKDVIQLVEDGTHQAEEACPT
jgi:hypothetical protein